MNSNILRLSPKGRNLKKLVEKCHCLYDEFGIDVTQKQQARKFVAPSRIPTLHKILTTNQNMNQLFPDRSECERAKIECREMANELSKALGNKRKTRTAIERAKNREQQEKEEDKSKKRARLLKHLNKEQLITTLLKHTPETELKVLLQEARQKREQKRALKAQDTDS
ncbi:hypothetical protein [Paenibacillus sp. FSL W8-0194]|uniref:hypothetical protein n=1 Tax=Paenibacillus sp. FSL W8-0194 TaxID=2921711 RepID=UPI0030D78CC0